jgi:mannan endo-1,6-alpha-mannosidase
VPTETPEGQVGETKPSAGVNTTCTPSTTLTVYVPPVTSAAEVPSVATSVAPVVPPVFTTLSPVVPPANSSVTANSSVPSATAPVEFEGAATSVKVMGNSILGAAVAVMVAGLL